MDAISDKDLFDMIYDAAPTTNPALAVELGTSHWAEMRARVATPHDAESCRLVYTSCFNLNPPNPRLADVWRARALARFALVGWTEGVAAILLSNALLALATENKGYPHGVTLDGVTGSENALAILDELRPFSATPGSGFSVSKYSPSPALIERFLWEKRGLLLLLLDWHAEALESYDRAAAAAVGSERGVLKVRAGRLLVEYTMDLNSGATGAASLEGMRHVVIDANALDQPDLVRDAEHNVRVMERHGRDLVAFEIL